MNKYLDRDGLIELWSRIKSTFVTKDGLQDAVEEDFGDIINNKSEDLKVVIQSESIPTESVENLFSDSEEDAEDDKVFLNLEGLTKYDELLKQYVNNLMEGDPTQWGTLGSSSEGEEW